MTRAFVPEKAKVAHSFDRAAIHYDDVAILQKQTGDELLERLYFVKLQPQTILDLGAGTGRNLAQLGQLYPKTQLIAADIAPNMLVQAKQAYKEANGLKRWLPQKNKPIYIASDAEQLSLADNSVDLVFANLALQWCDLAKSFSEIQRVLRPEGLCVFTTLGPDTLHELRESWASVDDYPHVNVFYDMHDIGEAMMNAKLAEPVLDMDRYTLTYDTALALMKDLKVLGARNVNSGRRPGLTGKQALKKVSQHYEQFRQEGLLPASYEVIYGHAWSGAQAKQSHQQDGSIHIPISQIQRL